MQLSQQITVSDIILKEGNKLFNFIRKRVNSKLDAEDILQDVYFQLAKISHDINSIERMSAWLFQIARNKITDNYRKKKSLSFSDLDRAGDAEEGTMFFQDFITDEGDLQDDLLTRDNVWQELEEALEELPQEQREVFELHEFQGMSFKEISEKTGVQVNTLLSRKRYATIFLRKKLDHLYQEILDK
ncbi:sigma-70 family RNA polymerase sigma factor [Paracrocinitomix mangrovi]|uniref:RNA polymerase sigma factor n=1 Tax=Paracrocinitomix mangrovi TaxID=2862509 RepID=UPI001C8E2839|nr:sigma-70 family RNA polymerase sigma factor [Paracrocinitomix mangrovi]UKN00679.1 sigma-70 family RNA polymerase sigma factor [Paracrocinitomix mangrovi]